jgi:uncharacterized protein
VAAVAGWSVFPQRGQLLGERLAHAHQDASFQGTGPVLQIGMDTPQMTVEHLHQVVERLGSADAVLGAADDGGWWVLGLNNPNQAALLRDVTMSTPTTGAETRRTLRDAGLVVGGAATLRDVDSAADADAVAAACATGSEFARLWDGHGDVRNSKERR